MTYTCSVDTPLGPMTAAAENDALIGLWFIGQKHYPAVTACWNCEPDHPIFKALKLSLSSFFNGGNDGPEVPLAPQGTPFQMAVWSALLRIPYGRTVTYGEIAKEIAHAARLRTMSAQAVGGSVGRNPISILIPCHRVLGCNERLTGYAGGLDKKEALLRLERGAVTLVPK